MSNLPPGCSEGDIDRAAGPYDGGVRHCKVCDKPCYDEELHRGICEDCEEEQRAEDEE